MREGLRRRCLWWTCLAAAAMVAAPDVVSGAVARVVREVDNEGQCEVLDLSEGSLSPAYVLPTTLTLKPSAAQWRLDVILGQGEAAVCVRLEERQSRLRVTAAMKHCDEGDVRDYNFLSVSPQLGNWTSLTLNVEDEAVTVSAKDGTSTSVVTHGPPLPHDGPVALTGARDVKAAVGCSTSCPGYRHTSLGNDKKVTVKQWNAESVHFHFRPADGFVKLEYEVTCTTPLGHTILHHAADITLNQTMFRNLWHQVHLQHHRGMVTVQLDQSPPANKTLSDCTFTEHTIRVMGDALFSFTCDPSTGKVERMKEADPSLAQAGATPLVIVNIAWAIVVVALLVVIVFLLVQLPKPQNSNNNNNNNNDHNSENGTTITLPICSIKIITKSNKKEKHPKTEPDKNSPTRST